MDDNPKLRHNSAAYTLVLHLFRRFMVDNDMDTSQGESATIRDFYTWANLQQPLFPDQDELSEAYEFDDKDDDSFEFVEEIFSDPFVACGHLTSWWPALVYAQRPPLKRCPVSIFLNAGVVFDDGQIATVPMMLGRQQEPYTAGLILTFWHRQLDVIEDLLRTQGVDFLYNDKCTEDSPEATREVRVIRDMRDPDEGT